jgi:hypothetical protein
VGEGQQSDERAEEDDASPARSIVLQKAPREDDEDEDRQKEPGSQNDRDVEDGGVLPDVDGCGSVRPSPSVVNTASGAA